MNRFKFLFAAVVVAAIVAITSAANAQQACKGGGAASGCNVHFVGAGSSAQFLPAGIGADQLAGVLLANGGSSAPNYALTPVYETATQCVYHWSAKNGGNIIDNRGTVAIPLEPANIWLVWVAGRDETASITSYSIDSSGNITFTGTLNALTVNESVSIAGLSTATGLLIDAGSPYTVTATGAGTFTVASSLAQQGATSDTGTATGTILCPSQAGTSTGNNSITDVWVTASVDSTVGNRTFLAQNTAANGGSGDAVEILPIAAGNLLTAGSNNLWPDNASDVSILNGGASNAPLTVGEDQTGLKDVHVSAGMTDIRPDDAWFATNRAIGKITATRSGLGYNSSTNVGASILTSEGTGSKATPVKFNITGNDPITDLPVRSYTAVPIGAAPVVFIYNNGGDASGIPYNVVSGVIGDGVASGPGWPNNSTGTGTFPLANLFDGSTSCDTHSAAFGGPNDGAGTAITVWLREPLSGTMNTTEFNVFRTTGNTEDSQEQNVFPGSPYIMNPLSTTNSGCGCGNDTHTCTGLGTRLRAIGTGEVIGSSTEGVLGTPHSVGYAFMGFANFNKFASSSTPTHYNYLTVDGVDPFGFQASVQPVNQGFIACAGPCKTTTYWSGESYPNLRNGSYKVYSTYRWLVPSPDTDAYGPTKEAQFTENAVDDSVADFVPFQACPQTDPTCSSSTPVDGMPVYRSHFTQTKSGTTCGTASGDNTDCNGTPTLANLEDGGNALGVGEAGGDVGGLVEGPFGTSYTSGYVTIASSTCTTKKGFKISRKTNVGDAFVAGKSWENQTITIGGVAYTVSPVSVTATTLYVGGTSCSGPVPPVNTKGLYYYIGLGGTPAATAPGIISKKE